MKSIVAINCSPRSNWNTDILVREAASGAEAEGAEVEVVQLYKLEKFTGCVSCFGCKTEEHKGECVYRDGLYPVLEKIRRADGLIIGTPNYLGDATAGFRALYERLIFQYITYKTEPKSYSGRSIPVLLIFTGNCAEELYAKIGYDKMMESYKNTLSGFIGPAELFVSGDTLQVNDYDRYNWTMFDPEAKKKRRETVFPQERREAFRLGGELMKRGQTHRRSCYFV